MSEACGLLHEWANSRRRHCYPFDWDAIPQNGIFLLFENAEHAHGGHRIVRTGSHRRADQLPGRIAEHYVTENKDRSILRKNIGRALLRRDDDPLLKQWDLDLTARAEREQYRGIVDERRQEAVEHW